MLGAMDGKSGAEVDYFSYLIDAHGQTLAGIDRLSPEARAMARAYADGINRFVADHPDEVIHRPLFPVTEVDIIEGFVLVSPLFFGLDMVVGDLVEGRNLDLSETFGDPMERGSNAFLIAPSRMEDGSTVLISNSHQPWYGPAAWYEARLASGEGWSMQGVTFPGVPTILMGHNAHLGWTNTVNRPDMVDVYQLVMDKSGKRYELDGEWVELERKRVWLRVKMGPVTLPVPRTMERSVHGPVIRNDKGVYAFRYASEGETRHLDQYYRLMRTTTLSEWREVMAMQAVPGTNFLYADKEGNIGFLYNAAFPDRDARVDWSGVLPGDRADLIWEGYEPSENIPFLLNPPSGFIYNANNTPLMRRWRKRILRRRISRNWSGLRTG
jgi:acyl-homoserine-lactone acylase